MRIRVFDWDDHNVRHIGRHGVEPHEAEAVCRSAPVVLRGRNGSYLVYGRAAAGRYLVVVLRILGEGVGRIITARDLTDRERRFYHRRH